MILDWVSFLAYPNLFEIKGFVVVVVGCEISMKITNTVTSQYHFDIFFHIPR
jgi:hypothetical protein